MVTVGTLPGASGVRTFPLKVPPIVQLSNVSWAAQVSSSPSHSTDSGPTIPRLALNTKMWFGPSTQDSVSNKEKTMWREEGKRKIT